MTNSDVTEADLLAAKKRIAHFVLRSGLFWNNEVAGVHNYVLEDGIFYHHSSMSAGEHFFEFLRSIGVLLREGGQHRLAIRPDAIAGYAAHLVDQGQPIERFIEAIADLGSQSWLHPDMTPFNAKFYENPDGTTSYDCRQFLTDIELFGYVRKDGEYYQWTEKMAPFLAGH